MRSSQLAWLEGLSPQAQAALLTDVRQTLRENQLSDYRPYPKQLEFHAAGAKYRERLLRAGNQNGKTYPCGREWAMHLTGIYPDGWPGRRWDRPVVCWASSETGESTRDNPQRALLGLPGETGTGAIPRHLLGDYGMASGVADLFDYMKVKHVSGGWSMLRLKYYAQGRRKWQGPPVDAVWFDEEPEEDIYDEGLARTIATGGMAALTFTPLLGMSNVVKRFLMDKSADRHDTNMTIDDAEHIPVAERARIIASFQPHEREARARGIPTVGSGRIFPLEEQLIEVAPFRIPDYWPRINGLDFGGADHPTAVAGCAWDRDADVFYVVNGYKRSGLENQALPPVVATAVKGWGEWVPVAWPHDGLQHDKGSMQQVASQYRRAGLKMLQEHATHEAGGFGVEAGLVEMLERMQTGRWKVFSTVTDWFEEFRLYHRANGAVVKKFDDLISASRYALMMRRFAKIRPKPQASAEPWQPLDKTMGW